MHSMGKKFLCGVCIMLTILILLFLCSCETPASAVVCHVHRKHDNSVQETHLHWKITPNMLHINSQNDAEFELPRSVTIINDYYLTVNS